MKNPLRSERGASPGSHGLARRVLAVTAIVTVIALAGAASVVGATTGSGPLAAPTNIASAGAEDLGITASGAAGTPGPGTVAAPGAIVAAATTDGAPAPTTEAAGSASPTDASQTSGPHQNTKGCDDTLFANGSPPFATPGGPTGCTVGNSGDHRQNGMKSDDSATDAAATSDTTGAAGPKVEDKAGPHANGNGCDDTLFANGTPPFRTPGGPAGCTAGSSGEHRQNGVKHSGGGADTSGATPGTSGADASSSRRGPGNPSLTGNSAGSPAAGGGNGAETGPGKSGKGNSGNKP